MPAAAQKTKIHYSNCQKIPYVQHIKVLYKQNTKSIYHTSNSIAHLPTKNPFIIHCTWICERIVKTNNHFTIYSPVPYIASATITNDYIRCRENVYSDQQNVGHYTLLLILSPEALIYNKESVVSETTNIAQKRMIELYSMFGCAMSFALLVELDVGCDALIY